MRDVFVEVRENEKEFKHAIALLRIRFAGAFFEVFYDSQGVSEQPFEAFRVHRAAGAAALKGLVGANERFVEEMVEAELLAGEGPRNRLRTRLPFARDRNRRVHYTPQSAFERPSLEAVGTRLAQQCSPGEGGGARELSVGATPREAESQPQRPANQTAGGPQRTPRTSPLLENVLANLNRA